MPTPKILLVDDVDFFLEIEKDFLRQTPAEILLARNGQTALELTAEHRPNLIFMDVHMPVMDGLTCCRRIKADPQLTGIPVVMVFAPSADVNDAACRAAGCDEVLRKPVDRNAFLELGRRFLFDIDRREKRVSCQIPVEFRIGGRCCQGTGRDVSLHGMYIGFREEVQPNERVQVTFSLPEEGAERIELNGRVAWLNRGFPRSNLGLPQGFGVEFRRFPAGVAAIFDAFLERFTKG
jgi:CheY-like chemotaxis protein